VKAKPKTSANRAINFFISNFIGFIYDSNL
jgi:hypothetical protein